MVGLCAVLMQKYSPQTVDQILSDPTVKQFTLRADKFIQETKVQVYDIGYPLYLSLSDFFKPLTRYNKLKVGKTPGNGDAASEDKIKKKRSERVMTVEELKNYDGKPGSKGLYLALLGLVFNVKKGKQHYGPGGGYEFFAGETL